MKSLNLTRKSDEITLKLTLEHSASSYGLPVALLDGKLVDSLQIIGPDFTVGDAVKARALDLISPSENRFPALARKFCQRFLSQNPTGPQIPAHCLK